MDGDPSASDAVATLSSALNRLKVATSESSPSSKRSAPRSPGKTSDSATRGSQPSPSHQSRTANLVVPRVHNGASPSLAIAPAASLEEEAIQQPTTAASIASNYFSKELSSHGDSRSSSDTIVLVHDSCYGHRWSRPRTKQDVLDTIVERPERLQAAIRGVAAAYVRLGERHGSSPNAPHPQRDAPRTIPFRIKKTSRILSLTSAVPASVHGMKWMKELHFMCESAEIRQATGQKELARPEEAGQAAKPKLHEGDLYLCRDTLDALQGALGGVIDGVDAVFTTHKKAFVCIRPPGHHCSADLPSGFCWINNVHVGIEHAAQTHGLTHAAIIDFDLHHGDGSQTITWERNAKAAKATKKAPQSEKMSIGYFSLHDINSYPCESGDTEKVQSASLCLENAHAQTLWNIHLKPWASEGDFWKLYHDRYSVLIEKARQYLRSHTAHLKASAPSVTPKAAIFISAGFDASEWESSGMQRHKVNVPTLFYSRFTADIVKLAREEGTGVDGRVISVLEGGYSDRALTSGALSHLVGLTSNGDLRDLDDTEDLGKLSEWWSPKSLSDLETQQFAAVSIKEPRNTEPQAFWSPTRSFSAKVVDPSKLYRSISGTIQHSRPPSPPPPEVDWLVATHELTKLLIPSDRQINSCKAEELAEVKVKRERISNVLPPPQAISGDRMQTRGRRSGMGVSNEQAVMPPPPPKPLPSKTSSRQSTPGIPTISAKRSSPTKPVDHDASKITARKSRRVSDAQELLANRPTSMTSSVPVTQSHQATSPSVESLTAGVKKITLRYNPPKEPEPTMSKHVKKAPVARQPKPTSLPKAPSGKKVTSERSRPSGDTQSASVVKSIELSIDDNAIATARPRKEQPQSTSQPDSATFEPQQITETKTQERPLDSKQASGIPAGPSDVAPASTTSLVFSPEPNEAPTKPPQPPSPAKPPPNDAVPPQPPSSPSPPSTLDTTSSSSAPPSTRSNAQTPHTPAPPSESNQFIPYVPEADPTIPHPQPTHPNHRPAPPLTWLPPNTSTPAQSPAPKRAEQKPSESPAPAPGRGEQNKLPVFTAEGHIPFAQFGRRT